ncbi:MAG: DinB family protein [Chloroflexi bacterium]|nr:DinB family protein [Chloroflexota bacterium]
MNEQRRQWAQRQQQFRRLLATKGQDNAAISLFLKQHAVVHSAAMSRSGEWSFQDDVLAGLSDDQLRFRPVKGADPPGNSIIWIIWHIARIEDATMNILVAGRSQVLSEDMWLGRFGLERTDVGTGMADAEVSELSEHLAMEPLRAYRIAVGRRTREIVTALRPGELADKIDPDRVRILMEQGALAGAAYGLAQAWARRRKEGMLTMPATRHSFTHLNEARSVREKLLRMHPSPTAGSPAR